MARQPHVSFVIPSLNSAKTVEVCLASIFSQRVPRSEYEIVLADSGSTDETVSIARRMGVDTVVDNPLKTGEDGKAAGIKAARSELIALVERDNDLTDESMFAEMVAPFSDSDSVVSEPLEYTVRKGDPALTRYFARLGMNDPLCLCTGNYDRICAVTGRWTGLDVHQQDVCVCLCVCFFFFWGGGS